MISVRHVNLLLVTFSDDENSRTISTNEARTYNNLETSLAEYVNNTNVNTVYWKQSMNLLHFSTYSFFLSLYAWVPYFGNSSSVFPSSLVNCLSRAQVLIDWYSVSQKESFIFRSCYKIDEAKSSEQGSWETPYTNFRS
jgi:hypothetical protein